METEDHTTAFSWNAGGWFGSQIGCTLWLGILGLVLLTRDVVAAMTCLAGFGVLNAWGLILWRRRGGVSAYAAIQRFLLAASVVIGVVVMVVNSRGVSTPPAPGALVSTHLPYWVSVMPPALMTYFFILNRIIRRGRK